MIAVRHNQATHRGDWLAIALQRDQAEEGVAGVADVQIVQARPRHRLSQVFESGESAC
ncbi:hypothetical protein ACQP2F_16250 [Actinoplanes sp. CA-030573]|uniref:hypothetical protein n=1 Tax=Actinoplanes sp. CA-030573 TaxID=3239898 RepID=UPI003D89FBE0